MKSSNKNTFILLSDQFKPSYEDCLIKGLIANTYKYGDNNIPNINRTNKIMVFNILE